MRRILVDPRAPDEAAISEAVSVLRRGGVIAFPTETFYALGADASNDTACRRVHDMKGRAADKSLPVIVADWDQLEAAASRLTPLSRRLAHAFWPGPLTLVVEARSTIAACSAAGTLAARVSSLPLARRLAEVLGSPVTSTSANRSGELATRTGDEVEDAVGAQVDLLLDGGPAPGGAPSTIVDARSLSPRLVRAGKIPFEDVLEAASESGSS